MPRQDGPGRFFNVPGHRPVNQRAAGNFSICIRIRDAASIAGIKTLPVREDYGWLRLLMHRRHQLKSPKALLDVGSSAWTQYFPQHLKKSEIYFAPFRAVR